MLADGSDGRPYVPFTIRRLVDGKQIGIHHDYHYRLDLYRETVAVGRYAYIDQLRGHAARTALRRRALCLRRDLQKPRRAEFTRRFLLRSRGRSKSAMSARFVDGPGDLFLLASVGPCIVSAVSPDRRRG